MSKVITTTGVTAKQIEKFSLTVDKAIEALNATFLQDEPVKKDLTVGKYIYDTPNGFKIYTVEDVDVAERYDALTSDEQEKCWQDGYKRQHVNRPAHEAVKAGLGIKEQSAGSKAVLKAKTDILSNMVKAGMESEQIYACFPDMDETMLDTAIESIKATI